MTNSSWYLQCSLHAVCSLASVGRFHPKHTRSLLAEKNKRLAWDESSLDTKHVRNVLRQYAQDG